MGAPGKQTGSRRRGTVPSGGRFLGLLVLLAAFILTGSAGNAGAVQKHELSADQAQGGTKGTDPAHTMAGAQPQSHTPESPTGLTLPGQSGTAADTHAQPSPSRAPEHLKASQQDHKEAPGIHAPGTAASHDGGHGPSLPEISPIPGVTFVETMIKLMEHELKGRLLGWRPNDIVIGRFTDDINNYQLGVLEAIRFTTLRLKDSLTRMGDADSYDPDLEQALNLFMNRSTSFWIPSAESSYEEAVDHLKIFLEKLKSGQRNFYYRKDNLIGLIATYKDLLGNINKNLVRADVGWFKADDYFYYAKGVAHVYNEVLRVVRVGYQSQLGSTINALEILDEILHELHRVEEMDPWIILNSDLDGFFANHRANLNGPLSEVAHMLVVLSQF